MEDIVTRNKVKQIKDTVDTNLDATMTSRQAESDALTRYTAIIDDTKYLVDTATSTPVANSIGERVEAIQDNCQEILEANITWEILQVTQAGAGNTTVTYTVPVGKTVRIYGMSVSCNSVDLTVEVTVNGNTWLNQGLYGHTDIGSHNLSLGANYIKLTAGQTITIKGTAGAAGTRYCTLSFGSIYRIIGGNE